jgi:diguanylate cyclase (GGDEF) domain
MKKWNIQREYILMVIIIILFASVSFFSLSSIQQMQGNARVVNYVGIVRGATQRLVKNELQGHPNDTLISRLDSIISELITGEGPNDLVVLEDQTYLGNMHQVQEFWEDIKEAIRGVRSGESDYELYQLSEEYFELVDRTVSSAEAYSEKQVDNSTRILIMAIAVFVGSMIIGLVFIIRSITFKNKAIALEKTAYIDVLTQMPNRADCEQMIDKIEKTPPENDIAVLMFDMNNLKIANDLLGHAGGDKIIAGFARIIKTEAAEFGFVCRYGGDEFLAIFNNATESNVGQYLMRVNEKIVSYNLSHTNEIEKISFAVGYVIGNVNITSINNMINEADRSMYARKRQMKENRD